MRLCASALQPLARLHPRKPGVGAHARLAEIPGELLFPVWHASTADLGHAVMCFEGISELAATEIEEEALWDGQAKSSRYQDFSRSGFITPPEFDGDAAA